jgi:hypothetical protein
LKGETVFPPIEVQTVSCGGAEKLVCLDGKHRILAIEQFNRELSQQKKEGKKETMIVLKICNQLER